jgi:4-hydroxybenzoate polyprenyltransferase
MSSSVDAPVTPFRAKAMAWLQVLRAPNLLTVPGDPLAGMLLAADPVHGFVPLDRCAAVVGASLLLYAAGLVGNDVMDIEEDRRDRPSRPLPRGLVGLRSAAVVAVLLAVAGVVLASWAGPGAGIVAAALAAAVVFYDVRGKRTAWFGPLNMALCRALSLLMGFALAVDTVGMPRGFALVAASALFVYIAVVSIVAREEVARCAGGSGDRDAGGGCGWRVWLPPAGMACGSASVLAFLAGWVRCSDPFVLATGAVALVGALAACAVAAREATPRRLPQTVGLWILCLIPMQAAWCLWSGHTAGLWAGACLLPAWPAAIFLAKRFYGS